MGDIDTYINILSDSLRKKFDIVKKILEYTKEQERILAVEEVDADRFLEVLDKKGRLIEQMTELDKGFESVYAKVDAVLKTDASSYRAQILQLQNYIRTVTDIGVEIQALEHKNKEKLNKFLAKKRASINDFKKSNKTATTYYQNMSNQHREWQSYFLDKRK